MKKNEKDRAIIAMLKRKIIDDEFLEFIENTHTFLDNGTLLKTNGEPKKATMYTHPKTGKQVALFQFAYKGHQCSVYAKNLMYYKYNQNSLPLPTARYGVCVYDGDESNLDPMNLYIDFRELYMCVDVEKNKLYFSLDNFLDDCGIIKERKQRFYYKSKWNVKKELKIGDSHIISIEEALNDKYYKDIIQWSR